MGPFGEGRVGLRGEGGEGEGRGCFFILLSCVQRLVMGSWIDGRMVPDTFLSFEIYDLGISIHVF